MNNAFSHRKLRAIEEINSDRPLTSSRKSSYAGRVFKGVQNSPGAFKGNTITPIEHVDVFL